MKSARMLHRRKAAGDFDVAADDFYCGDGRFWVRRPSRRLQTVSTEAEPERVSSFSFSFSFTEFLFWLFWNEIKWKGKSEKMKIEGVGVGKITSIWGGFLKVPQNNRQKKPSFL
jgi:hypothetical protein